MQNRWDDAEAREFVEKFADIGEDFALRLYTSRLIGGESALVLHGGGLVGVAEELLGGRGRTPWTSVGVRVGCPRRR